MLNVFEIYQDCEDKISPAENGNLSFERFNRFSWIAQLNLIDWLTGDVSGIQPPEPYSTQKDKDWLSDLIVPIKKQVVNGILQKPEDYYQWDNGYVLGSRQSADCDDEVQPDSGLNTTIDLLSGAQFTKRSETYIDELKPENKPICKMVGKTFEFLPMDIGNVGIEYIRYPKRAYIGSTIDPIYNQPVYNAATSQDFEWPEFARGILVWFIVNAFADNSREKALKETNMVTGKTPRG